MDNLKELKLRIANETLGQEMKKKVSDANYEAILDEKKMEVAEDLGLKEKIENVGWKNMTTKEVGQIGGKTGGQMVKNLIAAAEAQMAPVDDDTLHNAKKHLEGKQ
ncbi:small, acid-soluble spore protein, alpha/beta type [Sporomusa acidovorans]|uniref:Small, acid-soluble spore protein, alpha/beta type n=1 Tax=Sporomusa acidovorans (strain ATCC 49682 / DSM 3132 / Mol) TaxID=1123286 RepID=A0ABZ3J3J1_SPOA4|nr:small, acid-soluble spore protein, alpha/beta type [Sporomusa acidovorans]OZC20903.1 small, acid-soluble spore protein, alpha/beta type [Sporomusa acidovorans DSM 3132]SDE60583.1 Small, acid-soluble spore protein, alpha/beta type [Sporomusa acidovorans]